MKPFWFLAILIVLLFVLWRYQQDNSAPREQTVEEKKIEQPKLSKIVSKTVTSTAAASAQPPKTVAAKSVQLKVTAPKKDDSLKNVFSKPSDIVEFEVVDGLAVTQGDIVIGAIPSGFNQKEGWARLERPSLWPSGEIPYLIQENLPQEKIVRKAMEIISSQTRIHFIPYTGETDGIIFARGEKLCLSALGRIGGMQSITLEKSCGLTEIMHEILHALGFVHEQSLPHRDEFVEILWENIEKDRWQQFAVLEDGIVRGLSYSRLRFDYKSIMLYPQNLFAKTLDLNSMRSKTNESIQPVRDKLSETDIERVNELY